jgi:hypothetical protein
LKNITIGYSLPESTLNKLVKGSSLRLYVTAENLFTITDYSGMDPEVGGIGFDVGSYYINYDFYRPRLASTLNTNLAIL